MSGVTPDTRNTVLARAAGRCERCGRFTTGARSVHHRRRRGMGGVSGDRATVTNGTANLVVLCGTGTTGCHGWAEKNIKLAQDEGLVLEQWQNPTDVPITLHFGRVFLTDDGGYEYAQGGAQ